jgi:hypothetical protein
MAQKTKVYICCSPIRRSGVTTTARLLTDYFICSSRTPVGFDIDPREPDYAVRFPRSVAIVDSSKIEGQIAMFDRLLAADQTPKIVDVQHRLYDQFFETIDQIGFVDEADRALVQPIVVFHADASDASLNASLALIRRWSKLSLVVATNKGAAPLGAQALDVLSEFPTSRHFIIGALDSVTRTCFEAPDFSLTDFLRTPPLDMSFVTHMALRVWTTAIFDQFRLFEIGMAMEDARFL